MHSLGRKCGNCAREKARADDAIRRLKAIRDGGYLRHKLDCDIEKPYAIDHPFCTCGLEFYFHDR